MPSGDDELKYYPCRVTLKDGTILDTVYIEPEIPYFRIWGIWPEDDRGKRSVKIEDVLNVEDSPTRLPVRFANEIYEHGESGMGYSIFTVEFSDGQRQACVTGGQWISSDIRMEKIPTTSLRCIHTRAGMQIQS